MGAFAGRVFVNNEAAARGIFLDAIMEIEVYVWKELMEVACINQ